MTEHTAFIGLGSNLENPKSQLEKALEALTGFSRIMAISPFYQSKAVGPGEQPDYLNAVAKLSTELDPLTLLDKLQAIENQQGRVRTIRWGARTLDLDILMYDELVLSSERLEIPHPRMPERNFVIFPLLDIDPSLSLPDKTPLSEVKQKLNETGLEKLGQTR